MLIFLFNITNFFKKNYSIFTDEDENKLEYTQIYFQYKKKFEKYIMKVRNFWSLCNDLVNRSLESRSRGSVRRNLLSCWKLEWMRLMSKSLICLRVFLISWSLKKKCCAIKSNMRVRINWNKVDYFLLWLIFLDDMGFGLVINPKDEEKWKIF